MDDPLAAVISCSDWPQIVTATNRVIPNLSPDLRRRFNSVFRGYAVAYGLEGVFVRMNGRTVAQILDEYQPPQVPDIVAQGELNGVRYTLYEDASRAGSVPTDHA